MITKQAIKDLRDKLKDSSLNEVREQLMEILRLKEQIFKRSDPGIGCYSAFSMGGEILRQVEAIERAIQALDTNEIDAAIYELGWLENSCLMPKDERGVQTLVAELDNHPEMVSKHGGDREFSLEWLFYNRYQKSIAGDRPVSEPNGTME